VTRRNARYTPLDVEGPLPLDMVRGVPAIMSDPLNWLGSMVRRHGDLVAIPLPRTPVLVLNTPTGVRRVLQENHRNYSRRTVQYGSLSLVTGSGLLTSDGELWRRHRRSMQPAFHHAHLDLVAEHTLTAARGLRRAFDGGLPVDADAATLRAMVEVVGRTLFADDLSGPGARIVTAVDDALRVVLARAKSPLTSGPLGRLPTPSARRLRRAVATLDDVCADLVRRRRARGWGEGDADLLAALLRAPDLTAAQIRDELVTAVIAGHETVASCLTWTLHLLAGAPQVQERLQAELDQVLAGREPRWSDVPDLTYTRAVIDESLRLYPPAWVISRRAEQGDEIDGVTVPAGTLVMISPWLLHRRPQAWPDPERFDPARFLGSGSGRGRTDYLPFGAGPRLCIGRDFALLQTVLLVAALLRDRTVRRPPGSPAPRVQALVTLRPRGGLPLLVQPRRAPKESRIHNS
jgi:cytochrome P450